MTFELLDARYPHLAKSACHSGAAGWAGYRRSNFRTVRGQTPMASLKARGALPKSWLGDRGQVTIEPAARNATWSSHSGNGERSGDRRARTCDGLGGALDMTGETELSGQCILVMEDNGVIARNAVSAVRGASVPALDLLPTAKMHSPSSRTPDPTQEKPVQLWRAVNSFAAA